MPTQRLSKTYGFAWVKDDSHKAYIEFGLNYDRQWDFLSCRVEGIGKTYSLSLDDWKFLGMLANEIAMLCKQEGVSV